MNAVVPLELADGSGGLNTRDPISGIRKNQFHRLQNYLTDEGAYLKKRGGQELIQYAPIDPTPYAVDANTLVHYTFDELVANDNIVDDANSRDLLIVGGSSFAAPSATALFPIGAGLGRRSPGQITTPASADGDLGTCFNYALGVDPFDNLGAITIRGWGIIPDSFSGKPLVVNLAPPLATTSVSNSGTPLFATTENMPLMGSDYPGEVVMGFQLWRDWDSAAGKNSSDPYVTFRLPTSGIAGTVTTLTSGALPTGVPLEFKFTYSQTTGLAQLHVNGTLEDEATVNGGGPVDDSDAFWLVAFGGDRQNLSTPNIFFKTAAGVILDEWEISKVVRVGFNYKNPRGNPMILEKADGTKQCVVAADSGIYYTVGDGNWNKITDIDPATNALLSPTARWDGAMIEDRLYMTNGTDTPLTWDGLRVVPTGEGVTPLVLSLAASGSGNSNGIHGYAYAFKYGDDITGLSPIAYITVAGNADVNIQKIPTRHDNCSSILIYKTKAGGTRMFLDREIANDPNVDSIDLSGPYVSGGAPDADSGADGVADGSTDTNLNDDADYSEILAATLTTAIKKNKYYLPEHNRLFGCGSSDFPYDLSWGALGNPDVFRATAFVSVAGDKGPLIGMATSHGEIVLSKNANATSILRGTDESNWTLTENIHPKVGARDHWSFVHRYPVSGNGKYFLCFVATDGIYAHLGNDIVELSDDIGPTFQEMAVNTSSKEDWITSTKAEFMGAASNGGAATTNVQQSRYEQDGLREFAGDVRVVNQLEYIGLWPGNDVLVPGKVLFICPVKVADVVTQEAFVFSTDANRNLYLTTDNFATASIVTNLDAVTGTPILVSEDHRIIEITYANTGGKDQYFVFTSNTSESGTLCRWNQTDGLWENSAMAFNTGLFWQADVSWGLPSSNFNDIFTDVNSDADVRHRIAFVGKIKVREFCNTGSTADDNFDRTGQLSYGNNFHTKHQQNITFQFQQPGGPNFFAVWPEVSISSDGGTVFNGRFTPSGNRYILSSTFYTGPSGIISTASSGDPISAAAGFHGVANSAAANPVLNNPIFTFFFKNRETAFWQGGTFRPQSFWDGTNLWFVASMTEDTNGNRACSIYSGPANGPYAIVYTPTQNSYIAIVSDGTNIWWTEQSSGGNGFSLFVKKSLLASFSAVAVGTSTTNYLPTRLSWNDETDRLVAIGKSWPYGDSYNYSGFIGSISTLNGALVVLKAMTANELIGALPVEIVYQTSTPFSHFVAMRNQSVTDPTTIYEVEPASSVPGDVSTFKLDAYEGTDATDPTSGIQSNLLFMPSSGVLGNYLWSDRLYWYAPATLAADGRMLQLGVPGTWTVQGGLTSRTNELGDFNAFGNLIVDYEGDVQFYMRNAANTGALAASERQVTANQPIQGFNPVTSFAQWRLLLIWDYTVALPTESPRVSVVDVGYFLGVSTVPPVVAEHWEGRTYFSMAEAGETDNNILIVYDKKNAFTTYRGWRIKGMKKFRNFLTALQDYQLVKLEVGDTDLGNLIEGLARTGALASGSIVALDDFEANVSATVNEAFPGKSGFVKITPYKANDEGSYPWMLEIAENASGEMNRMHGTPLADFGWDWALVWSLEIKTSDETTGNFVASPNQQECIQKLDLSLLSTPVGREYTGK